MREWVAARLGNGKKMRNLQDNLHDNLHKKIKLPITNWKKYFIVIITVNVFGPKIATNKTAQQQKCDKYNDFFNGSTTEV